MEIAEPSVFLNRDSRFGFIDKTGRMVIEPQEFDLGEDFSGGLALVRRRDLQRGYINRSGKMALDRWFDYARSFSEGLAAVRLNGECGYIESSGKYAIPLRYSTCNDFSEGIAIITTDAEAQGLDWPEGYGAIDRTGVLVIPSRFRELSDYSEGLAIANSGGQNYFVDRNGRSVHITDQELSWWGFRDGLAIVGAKGKRVYIDKSGKILASALRWLSRSAPKAKQTSIHRSSAELAARSSSASGVMIEMRAVRVPFVHFRKVRSPGAFSVGEIRVW